MAEYAKPGRAGRTDWLEEHLDDPNSGSSRWTRTPRPTRRATSAGRSGWNWKTDLHATGRPGLRRPGGLVRAALGGRRRTPDTTVDPVRRQQQLVRGVRLLDPEAPRVRQREAPERRPQEVGAREPRADAGRAVVRRDRAHRDRRGAARDPGAARRGARQGRSERSASWTSARPRSTGARSSRPTTCRRSRPRCPATSRAPRTSRGRRPRTTTARSSRRDELQALYEGEGITSDQEVIAYCRIGERSVPHVVRAARAARVPERQELRRVVDRVRLARRGPGREGLTRGARIRSIMRGRVRRDPSPPASPRRDRATTSGVRRP